MVENINGAGFDAYVSQSEKPVLVDFYSDTCVPCKRLSPILSEIEDEYSDKISVVKLNINYDGETAVKHDVSAVPTLVFYKDGEEINRVVGLVKKNEITEIIDGI